VPRQNGKNAVLEAREAYGITVCHERILHTSHRVDTSRKAFLRLVQMFETSPELKARVKYIRRTNGQEAIELKPTVDEHGHVTPGGLIEFSSRVNGGGRGSSYSVVVFDEAQEMTEAHQESIMYTLAAAPDDNRQMIFTGTPPSPVSPGTVFRRSRKSAIEAGNGNTDGIAWHEWSVPELVDVTERKYWYMCNPALGIRLSEKFTATECANAEPEGFARERLGWWKDDAGIQGKLPSKLWEQGKRHSASTPAKTAYAVKFSPDGNGVALCGARLMQDGTVDVAHIASATIEDGVQWLADWLGEESRADATAALAIDGKRGAGALKAALRECDYPMRAIMEPSVYAVCSASAMLYDAVLNNTLTHEPSEALDESATTSPERKIGTDGGWGFGGENSTIIEAVALALWAVKTTRRDPEGGCEIL
jgi:hypothetical protein